MKIRQNVRHWAAKRALTTPVIGELAREKLVDLHTRVFLQRAPDDQREARRDHLAAVFEGTIDAYVAALEAGYPEAEARELTHVQANFDFFNHGWTEMMEFPVDEVEAHYERYEGFYRDHGITIDQPLGEFEPAGGVPGAPSTPEKLDDPDHPHAEGGFADDVYVEGPDGDVRIGGREEPEAVDLDDAPGVDAGTAPGTAAENASGVDSGTAPENDAGRPGGASDG